MPLAKVIPIITGLVHTVLADQPNPLVQVMAYSRRVFALSEFRVCTFCMRCRSIGDRLSALNDGNCELSCHSS
jgi:hypothetical protein